MGKSFKLWILAFAIAGFTLAAYSQSPAQGPPQPTTAASQGNGRGPCGKLPDLPDRGNGPGIPPPVGLCLPINDYLLPLLLSGILLGSIMIWRMEKS
ncbi:hypothetical protein [Salinimicrobium sediminis]|nr:hypothetical protein [Salinimicrobium sediminis]